MYVCLCNAVSDKTINEMLDKGMSLKEVRDLTKAGKNCGACLPSIKTLAKKRNKK